MAARTHDRLGYSRNGVSEPAGDLRKRGHGNFRGIHVSLHGHGLSGRQPHDRTGGYAHANPVRQSVSVRGRDRMVHAGYAARLLAGAESEDAQEVFTMVVGYIALPSELRSLSYVVTT